MIVFEIAQCVFNVATVVALFRMLQQQQRRAA